MCELISAHWRAAHNLDVEPERIWNYSPRGELYMVFEWYEEALAHGAATASQ